MTIILLIVFAVLLYWILKWLLAALKFVLQIVLGAVATLFALLARAVVIIKPYFLFICLCIVLFAITVSFIGERGISTKDIPVLGMEDDTAQVLAFLLCFAAPFLWKKFIGWPFKRKKDAGEK